ncbi:hypothetical protein NKR23_g12192 [Pleurostoma richardsiae]|uniref:Phytanoyl-CoA dioxygenase n=1 Tax=Pleurostoma richardsiae TaxID=41990 RepID=A0AA38RF69_9PEZI|nr:hypothetical protein NKR23_g12192 [Pleurostoma richardsiae]
MASSSCPADPFEPNQVSSSISADESLQFLEDHGFFYQANAKIGELVDELLRTGRARSDDARLDYFKPTLRQDSRLKKILEHYPIALPRFRFPWGTTPGAYYNWDKKLDPTVDSGLVAYMLGSGSRWVCLDGSHGLDEDGKLVENGTLQLSDTVLENYAKRELRMEAGGVLLVRTRLAHQATTGRSIMLGLLKAQAGAPRNA